MKHRSDKNKKVQSFTEARILYGLTKFALVTHEELKELIRILSGWTSQVSVELMKNGKALKSRNFSSDIEDAVLEYSTNTRYYT